MSDKGKIRVSSEINSSEIKSSEINSDEIKSGESNSSESNSSDKCKNGAAVAIHFCLSPAVPGCGDLQRLAIWYCPGMSQERPKAPPQRLEVTNTPSSVDLM